MEPQLDVGGGVSGGVGGNIADRDERDAGGRRPPHGGARGHVARACGVEQAPGGDGDQRGGGVAHKDRRAGEGSRQLIPVGHGKARGRRQEGPQRCGTVRLRRRTLPRS